MEDSQHATESSGTKVFAEGAPTNASSVQQYASGNEMAGGSQQGMAVVNGEGPAAIVQRSDSTMSQSNTLTPSRGGTLRKRQSLKKSSTLRRSSSRKSLTVGSVKSLALEERPKQSDGQRDEIFSAFYTPVPTTGNPTDILANRFQAWRKTLKDLIAYYRDVQKSYESRSKSLLSISNLINNTSIPSGFLSESGIGDAMSILRQYHKQALTESNKARSMEEDIIIQLTGLRSDLQQKIREIKNLSGDFKNAVDKETESTRKAARDLQQALGLLETDPDATTGKGDPFIVKLGVDRQIERQIDEENYLHRAFLNLENSGRELESIVVGEIHKSYNVYTSILGREADETIDVVEKLRGGPLSMAKDHEWDAFIDGNDHFVNPRIPIRKVEQIYYPGQDALAAQEIRSGMLERKSKYLKSYTPGWYILSPTHLHEFKSADQIKAQSPIMSLYLPEQKLGSHSNTDSSSHKFMLKGRQTGGMHRGHGWVFRAESRDTMLAWYEDIQNLTEKTGEERNAFVRKHARSVSAGSHKAGSVSSDGAMEEDDADHVPYSATASQLDQSTKQDSKLQIRPQPGGRFPSDLNAGRDLRIPMSPSSGTSSIDHEVIAAADALPGSDILPGELGDRNQQKGDQKDFNWFGIPSGRDLQEYPLATSAEEREEIKANLAHSHRLDTTLPIVHSETLPVTQQKITTTSLEAEDDSLSREAYEVGSDSTGAIAHRATNSCDNTSQRKAESFTPSASIIQIVGRSHHEAVFSPSFGEAEGMGMNKGSKNPKSLEDNQQQQELRSTSATRNTNFAQQAHAISPTPDDTSRGSPRLGQEILPSQKIQSASLAPSETPSVFPGTELSRVVQSNSEQEIPAGGTVKQRPKLNSSFGKLSRETISDLHVPGEYPPAMG